MKNDEENPLESAPNRYEASFARCSRFRPKTGSASVAGATCVSANFRRQLLRIVFRRDDVGVILFVVGGLVRDLSPNSQSPGLSIFSKEAEIVLKNEIWC